MPILSDGTFIDIDEPSAEMLDIDVIMGPPGVPGVGGDSGVEVVQSTPLASWTIPVPAGMGRVPAVTVYVNNQQVLADVTADEDFVNISFPEPTSGLAILT